MTTETTNTNETNNTNNTPPAAPAAQQPAHSDTPNAADERDALIVQLREELQALKLQTAVAAVQKTADTTPLGNGTADARRAAAIRAAGGPAFWYAMSADQRAAVLGASTSVNEAELRKYFGKTSDAQEANRLARQNPAKYAALRVIAREKGIL